MNAPSNGSRPEQAVGLPLNRSLAPRAVIEHRGRPGGDQLLDRLRDPVERPAYWR